MNIYEMIEWLQDQPNKELMVLIAAPDGWFSVCGSDSKPEELDGNEYLMLKPCYGHDDEKIEFEVKGDDFEIDLN